MSPCTTRVPCKHKANCHTGRGAASVAQHPGHGAQGGRRRRLWAQRTPVEVAAHGDHRVACRLQADVAIEEPGRQAIARMASVRSCGRGGRPSLGLLHGCLASGPRELKEVLTKNNRQEKHYIIPKDAKVNPTAVVHTQSTRWTVSGVRASVGAVGHWVGRLRPFLGLRKAHKISRASIYGLVLGFVELQSDCDLYR